ncbi:MAG TPA: hypothetical protein VFK68_13100 [Propionibacteriaceae bacterium]|nr:hypothetical protein [Propionibacteriaceae bacterium]
MSVPERREPARRSVPLTIAAVLTGLFAVVVLGVAVGSAVQPHGQFSLGVGVMLFLYGALLAWVAWTTWRQRFYIRGALVGSALLNLAVALSSFSSNVALWSVVAVLSAVIAVCGVLPSTSRALTRARGDSSDDLPEV